MVSIIFSLSHLAFLFLSLRYYSLKLTLALWPKVKEFLLFRCWCFSFFRFVSARCPLPTLIEVFESSLGGDLNLKQLLISTYLFRSLRLGWLFVWLYYLNIFATTLFLMVCEPIVVWPRWPVVSPSNPTVKRRFC